MAQTFIKLTLAGSSPDSTVFINTACISWIRRVGADHTKINMADGATLTVVEEAEAIFSKNSAND